MDGIFATGGSFGNQVAATGNIMHIGVYCSGIAPWWTGSIDELMVWNSYLSGTTIAAHYAGMLILLVLFDCCLIHAAVDGFHCH